MRHIKAIAISLVLCLSGCTSMQRFAHMYSGEAPNPHPYQYKDGESSVYYTFTVGDSAQPDTLVFFYGGSSCPSWKSVMPSYVSGLTVNARIFVLNKRFVADRATGMLGCDREFHLANNPTQWVVDYSEFISTQLLSLHSKPKHVVLVGVSEGALVATRVAGQLPEITHLAIIGDGGFSLRESLKTLARKGAIPVDVDAEWKQILADPRSVEKKKYGHPYRWWSDVMDIDPLPDYLKLNIPILVGIGEKDESVPVESARFLESKFKGAGKNNLILKTYPEADHRLNDNGISYRNEFFAELSRHLK